MNQLCSQYIFMLWLKRECCAGNVHCKGP